MDRANFALLPNSESVQKLSPLVPERFVVFNPGSARASKRWPAEHFSFLADALSVPVVLVGAPGETAAAEVLAHCKSKPIDLSGKTSVADLVALISLSAAHIGGDTGSTHIAAALDIPAIGLYSATRPQRSCPYGQIDRCHFDPDGLSRIRPGDVLESVKEAIA